MTSINPLGIGRKYRVSERMRVCVREGEKIGRKREREKRREREGRREEKTREGVRRAEK